LVGHDEQDPVEGQGVTDVDRGDEVPDVDRVERAPQDSQSFTD
jgi:hypothetical protein